MKSLQELEFNHNESLSLQMNVGLDESSRKEISTGLSSILADSYSLMIMLHNYHWNIKGKNFRQIHLLTQEQYEELFEAIDEVAERIRSLGFIAPGSMREFSELYELKEPDANASEDQMIGDLLASHEHLASSIRKIIALADDKKDEATADLLTERIEVHEKYAWMLRSMLEV